MSEPECVRVVAAPDERAPAGDCYDMLAFSENNPSLKFKDRTTDSGDLKEVFSKFDATKKISSEILSRTRYLCAKYWRSLESTKAGSASTQSYNWRHVEPVVLR